MASDPVDDLYEGHVKSLPAAERLRLIARICRDLAAWAKAAAAEGFTGKLAIHPAQVATINAAFSPSEDDVRRAERIVALFKENPGAGALALDGEMVDKPHLVQARRIIALATRLRTRPEG